MDEQLLCGIHFKELCFINIEGLQDQEYYNRAVCQSCPGKKVSIDLIMHWIAKRKLIEKSGDDNFNTIETLLVNYKDVKFDKKQCINEIGNKLCQLTQILMADLQQHILDNEVNIEQQKLHQSINQQEIQVQQQYLPTPMAELPQRSQKEMDRLFKLVPPTWQSQITSENTKLPQVWRDSYCFQLKFNIRSFSISRNEAILAVNTSKQLLFFYYDTQNQQFQFQQLVDFNKHSHLENDLLQFHPIHNNILGVSLGCEIAILKFNQGSQQWEIIAKLGGDRKLRPIVYTMNYNHSIAIVQNTENSSKVKVHYYDELQHFSAVEVTQTKVELKKCDQFYCSSLCFSSNNKNLALGTTNGYIIIYVSLQLEGGKEVWNEARRILTLTKVIRQVLFSADGLKLIYANSDQVPQQILTIYLDQPEISGTLQEFKSNLMLQGFSINTINNAIVSALSHKKLGVSDQLGQVDYLVCQDYVTKVWINDNGNKIVAVMKISYALSKKQSILNKNMNMKMNHNEYDYYITKDILTLPLFLIMYTLSLLNNIY